MNESFPKKYEKEPLPAWAIEIGQRYHECKIIADKIEHDLGEVTLNNEGEITRECERKTRVAFYEFLQTKGSSIPSVVLISVQSKPQKHTQIGNALVSSVSQEQTYFVTETNERYTVSGNYETERDTPGSNYYVFPESPHFPGIKAVKEEKWDSNHERRNRNFQDLQVEKSSLVGGVLHASEIKELIGNLKSIFGPNDQALLELETEIKRLQDEAGAKDLQLKHDYSVSLKSSIINLLKAIQKTGKVKLPEVISGASNMDYSAYLFLLTKEAKIVEAPAHRKKIFWKETDEPDFSKPDLSKAKDPDDEFMLRGHTFTYHLLKQLPESVKTALES